MANLFEIIDQQETKQLRAALVMAFGHMPTEQARLIAAAIGESGINALIAARDAALDRKGVNGTEVHALIGALLHLTPDLDIEHDFPYIVLTGVIAKLTNSLPDEKKIADKLKELLGADPATTLPALVPTPGTSQTAPGLADKLLKVVKQVAPELVGPALLLALRKTKYGALVAAGAEIAMEVIDDD